MRIRGARVRAPAKIHGRYVAGERAVPASAPRIRVCACARACALITTRRKYADSNVSALRNAARAALPACRFYAEIVKFNEVTRQTARQTKNLSRALASSSSVQMIFPRPAGPRSRVSGEEKKRVEKKSRANCYARLLCRSSRSTTYCYGETSSTSFFFFLSLRYTAITINHRDEADKRVTSAIPRLTRCGFRLKLSSLTIDCILWKR